MSGPYAEHQLAFRNGEHEVHRFEGTNWYVVMNNLADWLTHGGYDTDDSKVVLYTDSTGMQVAEVDVDLTKE